MNQVGNNDEVLRSDKGVSLNIVQDNDPGYGNGENLEGQDEVSPIDNHGKGIGSNGVHTGPEITGPGILESRPTGGDSSTINQLNLSSEMTRSVTGRESEIEDGIPVAEKADNGNKETDKVDLVNESAALEAKIAKVLAESAEGEQSDSDTMTTEELEVTSTENTIEPIISEEVNAIGMDKNPEEKLSNERNTPQESEQVLGSELSSKIDSIKLATENLEKAQESLTKKEEEVKMVGQKVEILGVDKKDITTLNQEMENDKDAVSEEEVKLQVEIGELKKVAEGSPKMVRQLENNRTAMEIGPVKDIVSSMEDKIPATEVQEVIPSRAEAIIRSGGHSGAGLVRAIEDTVVKLNSGLDREEISKKTGQVFGAFATGILKELTAEGMSRSEAMDAYKAMVQALEASNGVIEVVMSDNGEMNAVIKNNVSEVVTSTNAPKNLTDATADEYREAVAT